MAGYNEMLRRIKPKKIICYTAQAAACEKLKMRKLAKTSCLTYCSGCSPIFRIIESSILRKSFGVCLMHGPS